MPPQEASASLLLTGLCARTGEAPREPWEGPCPSGEGDVVTGRRQGLQTVSERDGVLDQEGLGVEGMCPRWLAVRGPRSQPLLKASAPSFSPR